MHRAFYNLSFWHRATSFGVKKKKKNNWGNIQYNCIHSTIYVLNIVPESLICNRLILFYHSFLNVQMMEAALPLTLTERSWLMSLSSGPKVLPTGVPPQASSRRMWVFNFFFSAACFLHCCIALENCWKFRNEGIRWIIKLQAKIHKFWSNLSTCNCKH